jgi:hypothetical protein
VLDESRGPEKQADRSMGSRRSSRLAKTGVAKKAAARKESVEKK